ncbi:hypothetical protein RFI_35632, partial [Reticulomyxa filosa]
MIAEINRHNDYIVVYYKNQSNTKYNSSTSNGNNSNGTASTSMNTTNNNNNNNNQNRQQVLPELNFFYSAQYREEYELIELPLLLTRNVSCKEIRQKILDGIVPLTERSFRFLVHFVERNAYNEHEF